MKKISGMLFLLIFLVCGCGKETKESVIKDFKSTISNAKAYKAIGNMEISNDEETFTYSLESYYLKDNYYKVILVNQTSNHEQIILKNGEDIYVITPALNKSFKFQSDWPNNSSQAYLLDSLVKDVEKDKDFELITENDKYIIKSKVTYPNNGELKYEKIYLDNNKKVKKVEVYDENDIVKIKVDFSDIDLKANLKEEDFKIDEYIKENTCENGECNSSPDNNSKIEENSDSKEKAKDTANIENIIYPLYIPSNTFLTNSEKLVTGTGDRVILTFGGDKNFVLIEEPIMVNNSMEIIPVYGEPLMLSETVGALSANSLNWDAGNMTYYLASTELSISEMIAIANSLGNNTLVSKTK